MIYKFHTWKFSLNLLPWREKAKFDKYSYYCGIGSMICVCLFCFLLSYKYYLLHKTNCIKLENIKFIKQLYSAQNQLAKLSKLQNEAKILSEKNKFLKILEFSNSQIKNFLIETAELKPKTIFFNALKIVDGNVEIQGVAKNKADIGSFLNNLEYAQYSKNSKITSVLSAIDNKATINNFTLELLIALHNN